MELEEEKLPRGIYRNNGSPFLWIRYSHRGRKYFESAKTDSINRAIRLREDRLEAVRGGKGSRRDAERVQFEDLVEMIRNDYTMEHRSLKRINGAIHHLEKRFALMRAVDIDEARIINYVVERQNEKAADSTIRNEVSALKRAFNIAIELKKLTVSDKPNFPKITPKNVRQDFFTLEQFQALISHLPQEIQAISWCGYYMGWRISEILGLTWDRIDFENGEIRLDTSKNGDARVFPFKKYPQLEEVIQQQRKRVEKIEWEKQTSIASVFVWGPGKNYGKPIRDIRHRWEKACENAGMVGKHFHDLRRCTVRALEESGVARSVGMLLTGHRTQSVYLRYCIAAKADLNAGIKKLAAFHHEQAKAAIEKTKTPGEVYKKYIAEPLNDNNSQQAVSENV